MMANHTTHPHGKQGWGKAIRNIMTPPWLDLFLLMAAILPDINDTCKMPRALVPSSGRDGVRFAHCIYGPDTLQCQHL